MSKLIATSQLTVTNINDGQTPYIHFAYSDNADGTGLTTSDNGQRYMGHYSDYTQADSTDKSKYRWVDRWAKIEVGGRNLAQGTSSDWSTPYTAFSGSANTCPWLYRVLTDGLSVGDTLKSRIVLKYTNVVPASGQTARILLQGNGNVTGWNAGTYFCSPQKTISGSGEIVFEHEFKITADHLKNSFWYWQFRTDYIASGSLQWKLAKVEKGKVFTDWSPAPEDIQADINSKADQALTQQQINAINEDRVRREQELKAEMLEKAVEEWVSKYQELMNADLEKVKQSENELVEAAKKAVQIEWSLDGMKQRWSDQKDYIDVTGGAIILGKEGNNAQVKITKDRISMSSGGKDVMWIEQNMLHIENGVFTKTIQIGKFIFQEYENDADALVIRYAGG